MRANTGERRRLSPPSPTSLPGSSSARQRSLTAFARLALSVLLIAAFAVPALAGPFEDAVAKFANDDFSDTDEAIGVVADSGNPLAFPDHQRAEGRQRLSADPDSQEGFRHATPTARSSMPRPALRSTSCPTDAAAVRLNNRLRRTVDAALGSLTLLSPDPAKRIAAAQSVFKTHDEAALPVIDDALAKETNKDAKAAFTEARAAILLFKSRRHRGRQARGHRHPQGARRPGGAGAA